MKCVIKNNVSGLYLSPCTCGGVAGIWVGMERARVYDVASAKRLLKGHRVFRKYKGKKTKHYKAYPSKFSGMPLSIVVLDLVPTGESWEFQGTADGIGDFVSKASFIPIV